MWLFVTLLIIIVISNYFIFQGLGILSEQLYPFLVPVIKFSTDVTQEPHIYLLEDGLELWNVTLENSSVLTQDMFYLFSNLMPLLGKSLLEISFGFENRLNYP